MPTGLLILGVYAVVSCAEASSTARRTSKKVILDENVEEDLPPSPQDNVEDHAVEGDSVAAFQRKTSPLLTAWCGGCHGSGSAPYFAQPDVKKAHDDLLQSSKVDLKNPEKSRIYVKLTKEQHNCPTARCEESGAELLSAIKQWASDIGSSVDKRGESTKTAALTLNMASIIPSPTPDNPANPPLGQNMRTLTYDLAPLSGIAGAQLMVDIGLFGADGSYLLKNPRISLPSGSLRIKGVQPLINDHFNPIHATFLTIDQTVTAPGAKLSSSSLVALKDQGPELDAFAFAFEIIEGRP